MILATDINFKVGDIVDIGTMTNYEGTLVENVRCMIMRESNRDEYTEENLHSWTLERLKRTRGYNAKHFFEISVD